jgi:hypothetical protein
MSLRQLGGLGDRGNVQASRRKLYHRNNLFTRQMEPLHNLVDRSSHYQIVEDNLNRRSRVAKYPSAAALAGDALHRGTL